MASTNLHTPGTATRTIFGAWGLFVALLLVMLGSNMLTTVVGIRAESIGFTTTTTGVVLSLHYLGFLLGAWIVPRLVIHVGHIRVYAALASLCSSGSLIYAITNSPWTWGLARLTIGVTLSGMLIVAESWLNDAITNETRGRVLSIYMVVLMGGMALSQLLIILADPAGIVIFVVSSILVSLAIIPITLSATHTPEIHVAERLHFRTIWKAAPVGVVAGLGHGLGLGAFLSLAAVYGTRVGMSVDRIALFLSVTILGSLLLQGPLGWLSDRVRRRRLISVIALLSGLVALWMVYANPTSFLAFVIAFLFGATAMPLYALALSHINDWVPPGSAVSVSSFYLFLTGVGSFIGPIIGSLAIDMFGPDGLFWVLAVMFISITIFTLVRVLTHEGLSVEQQRAFTMVPARAGAMIIQIARRIRPNGESETETDQQPVEPESKPPKAPSSPWGDWGGRHM